ncbi:hypothetical protein BN1263250002 [Stenotrophomonas indicatrix]|nr:hypothetical protein BN1263250002 [Stenotrophomonas indicatrix]
MIASRTSSRSSSNSYPLRSPGMARRYRGTLRETAFGRCQPRLAFVMPAQSVPTKVGTYQGASLNDR